jgi:hypothetical protein
MPALSLSPALERLAQLEHGPAPLISLYLNARSGPQGRDQFASFVRKSFRERLRAFAPHSMARATSGVPRRSGTSVGALLRFRL